METTTNTTADAMFDTMLTMAHTNLVSRLSDEGMSVPEAVAAADDGMFRVLTMDTYFEGEEVEPDLGW